jgi:Xaa-Pro dipeptidase
LGQGIGLSPREYPILSKNDKTSLKEGMCLTVRLLVRDESLGAVMTGNTLLLTRKGPEILT